MLVSPAHAEIKLSQETKDYLEGIWLLNQKPDRGPCVRGQYSKAQIEFDFRKTGGRMVHFEPADLFGAATIESAEYVGNDVKLTIFAPVGGSGVEWRLHLFADRMEISQHDPNVSAPLQDHTLTAYRCGEADWSVNASVPREMLEVLTPLHVRPGKFAAPMFIAMAPELPDEEQCKRAAWGPNQPPFLGFEVFGPVHYFVIGQGFAMRFDLSRIRSVKAVDPHTLRLELVQRVSGGDSWGAGARGDADTITVELDDPHIRIPEIGLSFVRCDPRTLSVFRRDG